MHRDSLFSLFSSSSTFLRRDYHGCWAEQLWLLISSVVGAVLAGVWVWSSRFCQFCGSVPCLRQPGSPSAVTTRLLLGNGGAALRQQKSFVGFASWCLGRNNLAPPRSWRQESSSATAVRLLLRRGSADPRQWKGFVGFVARCLGRDDLAPPRSRRHGSCWRWLLGCATQHPQARHILLAVAIVENGVMVSYLRCCAVS